MKFYVISNVEEPTRFQRINKYCPKLQTHGRGCHIYPGASEHCQSDNYPLLTEIFQSLRNLASIKKDAGH